MSHLWFFYESVWSKFSFFFHCLLFSQNVFLGGQYHKNVVQYPQYHVTYSPAMFEVATSSRYGGDAFT